MPQRVVAELEPLPPASTWFGYYEHIDWSDYFDLWTPPAPAYLPDTGANSPDRFALTVLGILALLIGLGLITLEKSSASGPFVFQAPASRQHAQHAD